MLGQYDTLFQFWRATYNNNFSSLRRSCAVRTRHVCVTYVLNVDIFPRRSLGAQRTTRIFRPYVDHVRCVRVECWECELNENKFYFGGKHTRNQFMLKFFQYSQHISLRYAQVTRTWHLRGT